MASLNVPTGVVRTRETFVMETTTATTEVMSGRAHTWESETQLLSKTTALDLDFLVAVIAQVLLDSLKISYVQQKPVPEVV